MKLHLSATDFDAAIKDITDGLKEAEETDLERRKSRWAALGAAAGAKDRVEKLAADLLAHFTDRTATLKGKGMIVCMTRANAVRFYEFLKVLPGYPKVKVAMTGDLGRTPKAWSETGHLTTKLQRDIIKKRMVDPDDPLALVIVVDMWLTVRGRDPRAAAARPRLRRLACHDTCTRSTYIGIGDDLREEATSRGTHRGVWTVGDATGMMLALKPRSPFSVLIMSKVASGTRAERNRVCPEVAIDRRRSLLVLSGGPRTPDGERD